MARVVRKDPKTELTEYALEAYKNHRRRMRPLYPWVLVRVLPKEQAPLGRIILPDNNTHNKILYEGIVLEPGLPMWKMVDVSGRYQMVQMFSQYEPGDHVVFPHYEGIPVPYLNEMDGKDAYRVIRERNQNDPRCEIVGKLEYEMGTMEEQLEDALPSGPMDQREFIRNLLKEFYVVRRREKIRTVSGQ